MAVMIRLHAPIRLHARLYVMALQVLEDHKDHEALKE
jgi:hypothetical protein